MELYLRRTDGSDGAEFLPSLLPPLSNVWPLFRALVLRCNFPCPPIFPYPLPDPTRWCFTTTLPSINKSSLCSHFDFWWISSWSASFLPVLPLFLPPNLELGFASYSICPIRFASKNLDTESGSAFLPTSHHSYSHWALSSLSSPLRTLRYKRSSPTPALLSLDFVCP